MNKKQFSLTSRTVIGVLLLLLGLIFLLDNFAVIDAAGILRYWPALLVIFGGLKAVQPGASDRRIIGAVIAVIGVFMLLERMDILHVDFWALWPLLLIAAGAALIFRARSRSVIVEEADATDVVTGMAILGGMEQRCSSTHFRGGSVSAVLGGHEIDLRDASMPENGSAVLDVFAFMGGIAVRLPQEWTVVLEGTALLGGFENKTHALQPGKRQLIIRGQAILGGVEVKN
ncbi:MAG: hypothetical protein JXA28_08560 [Bacteroidetes bacterium]|nr:hypothetical protein [Bacteroidota bacterium]